MKRHCLFKAKGLKPAILINPPQVTAAKAQASLPTPGPYTAVFCWLFAGPLWLWPPGAHSQAPLASTAQPSILASPATPPSIPVNTVRPPAQAAWLRDLVQQVLLHQPELGQVSAEHAQVLARLREAQGAALPQWSLNASLGHENQNLAGRNNDYPEQWNVLSRVAQPLFDPSVSARTRQARAQMWGADWSVVQVREQVMLRTVELFAELVRQSRLVELARTNLRLHRQYVSQMKDIARLDLGRASDLPVAQSRVALAESVLTSRLQRLEAARVQWRAHTGMPSPEESPAVAPEEVMRDLPDTDVSPTLESAVQEALTVHPLLQKALAEVVVANEGIGMAGALSKPKLQAEVTNRNANNYGGVFNGQRTWYAGVNVQWSFSASNPHAERAAIEAVRAAQETVDRQALAVRAMVESQWYEMKAAHASLKSFDAYAEQAELVASAYAEQFKIGRRSLLDVLNAENELFTARSNVTTTQMDLQLARWRLTALRGLLVDELGL